MILGFEINEEPLKNEHYLKIPRLSLIHLVDVGAKNVLFHEIRYLLKSIHEKKYAYIPVYKID